MTYVHVQDVMELLTRDGNRQIHLPYGIVAQRQYDQVQLKRWTEEISGLADGPFITIDHEDLLSGRPFTMELGSKTLYLQIVFGKNYKDIPENRYTKWFDYDKIKERLIIRTRRTGDFLSIRGTSAEVNHKSVKDYMVTEKIPKQDRDKILLLTEGNHVLWIVGHRISEYYKISKNTKRILQVQLRGDCKSSETEENNGRTC